MSDNELVTLLKIARNKTKNDNTAVMNRNLKIYQRYSKCKQCNGTLYLSDGSACSCLNKYRLDNKLDCANVGVRYRDVTLNFYRDNLIAAKVTIDNKKSGIDQFIKYIDLYVKTFDNRLEDGRGFILCGNTGCGKTGALCYIVKEIITAGYNSYYIDTNELLETILLTYNDDIDTYEKKVAFKKLETLKTVDLLILDDFGSEYSRNLEWLYNIFLRLLKTRYSRNKPTLMSTNLKSNELMKKFDKEMADRLNSVFNEIFDVIILTSDVDVRNVKGNKSLIAEMKKEVKMNGYKR